LKQQMDELVPLLDGPGSVLVGEVTKVVSCLHNHLSN